MNKFVRTLTALLMVVAFLSTQLVGATSVSASNDQVCAGLDSGKIDLGGEQYSFTAVAPAGKLISGYCVKAGSAKQGNGPHYESVDPPAVSVAFSHPSGKAISHYSLSYVDNVTEPEPTVAYPGLTAIAPDPAVCGVDGTAVPVQADGVTYGSVWYEGNQAFVTATANEGFVFEGGVTQKTLQVEIQLGVECPPPSDWHEIDRSYQCGPPPVVTGTEAWGYYDSHGSFVQTGESRSFERAMTAEEISDPDINCPTIAYPGLTAIAPDPAVCGVDGTAVPVQADGVTYGSVWYEGNQAFVTATANEGFVFEGGVTQKTLQVEIQLGVECPPPFDGVTVYTPVISKTCEGFTFSHAEFKHSSMGVATQYEYSITGDGATDGVQPYTPGSVISVNYDDTSVAHNSQVTLWAEYEGYNFRHQLGQSRIMTEPCEVEEPVIPEGWEKTTPEMSVVFCMNGETVRTDLWGMEEYGVQPVLGPDGYAYIPWPDLAPEITRGECDGSEDPVHPWLPSVATLTCEGVSFTIDNADAIEAEEQVRVTIYDSEYEVVSTILVPLEVGQGTYERLFDEALGDGTFTAGIAFGPDFAISAGSSEPVTCEAEDPGNGGTDPDPGDGDTDPDPGNGDGTDDGNGDGTDPGNGDGTDDGNGDGTDPGNDDGTDDGNGDGTDPGNGDGTDDGNGDGTDDIDDGTDGTDDGADSDDGNGEATTPQPTAPATAETPEADPVNGMPNTGTGHSDATQWGVYALFGLAITGIASGLRRYGNA